MPKGFYPRTVKPFALRFWAKVEKTPGCWLWLGAKSPLGYGAVYSHERRRAVKAHRAVYELVYGPLPRGSAVCHRCDNPSCVRPDHLFLGTVATNNADRDAKGRTKHTPLKGHNNGASRLTEDQVRTIRNRYAAGGVTQTALAEEFGATQAAVSAIILRTRWAHI